MVQETGAWRFYWSLNGSTYSLISFSHATTTNRWYHYAISRNGGTIRMYLDGVLVGSSAISGAIMGSTQKVLIGKINDAEAPQFIGSMNSVRITKGTGRYPANFTPPLNSEF